MGRIDDALKRAAGGAGSVPELHRDRGQVEALQSTATVEDYPAEARRPPSARVDHPDVTRGPDRVTRGPDRPEIPDTNAQVAGKLVTDPATPAQCIEQYRRLAASLHEMQLQHDIKTVMVSSAVPGEGKTLTSVNLALTLAHSYQRRVLLIDADLRRPSVHNVFDLPNGSGLGDGLSRDSGPLPIIEVTKHLSVLPAGQPNHNPTAALTSDRMRAILQEAARQFDWVVLDSPPVGLLADAKLMSSMVDGVILVIGAGSTNFELTEAAVAEVGRERIIGTVLNRVAEEDAGPGEYYDYYYYAHSPASSQ